jgi:hypothetical protein
MGDADAIAVGKRDRRVYPGRGRRAGRRFLRLPALLACGAAGLLAIGLSACGPSADGADDGTDDGTTAVIPDGGRGYVIERLPPEALELEGAASSLDDLLRTIERGFAESDTARLHHLMIGEREYREILYPALPAAHPPINASFETLWVLQYPDSYRGMEGLLARYGGTDVRILDVRFEAPDQDFVNFVLHEGSRVDLAVDGRTIEDVRLFGSVVRVGDQWKVLTYPDTPDDPS